MEFLLREGGRLPGIKLSKALEAKDGRGWTPFLAAVAADAYVPCLLRCYSRGKRMAHHSFFRRFSALQNRSRPASSHCSLCSQA